MAGIRAKKKQQTRQKLKEAAISLFLQSPVTSVGPPDIARAAGVAQGTFYVHFTDRNELVDQLVKELNEDMNSKFIATLIPMMNQPVSEGLVAAALFIFKYNREHPELVPLQLDYITRSDREFTIGTNTVLLQSVKKILINLSADALQADLTAHALLALWRQFTMRRTKEDEVEQEIAKHLVQMTLTLAEDIAPDVRDLTISTIVSMMLESSE